MDTESCTTATLNIGNVNTAGHNRQEVIQRTDILSSSGTGFIGHGVRVSTVQHVYSELLVTQAQQAQTKSSQLDAHFP